VMTLFLWFSYQYTQGSSFMTKEPLLMLFCTFLTRHRPLRRLRCGGYANTCVIEMHVKAKSCKQSVIYYDAINEIHNILTTVCFKLSNITMSIRCSQGICAAECEKYNNIEVNNNVIFIKGNWSKFNNLSMLIEST
jgi:hypothetical protein